MTWWSKRSRSIATIGGNRSLEAIQVVFRKSISGWHHEHATSKLVLFEAVASRCSNHHWRRIAIPAIAESLALALLSAGQNTMIGYIEFSAVADHGAEDVAR